MQTDSRGFSIERIYPDLGRRHDEYSYKTKTKNKEQDMTL